MSGYQYRCGGSGRDGGRARGGGQYPNQGRGRGANRNGRGPHPQHLPTGDQSSGYAQPGSGTHYPQPRGPQGYYMGSTPSGSSPQQIYAQPGSGTQHQYQDRNPRAQYPQPRAPQGYYMGSTSSGSSPQQIYAQPGSGTQPRGPQGVGSTPSGSSPQQIYAQPGSGTQHQYQDRNPRAQYPQPRGPQGVGSTPSGSSQQISAQPGSGTQHQYQDRNPRAQYPQPRGPQGVGSTPSGSSPQQISAQPGSGTQHQYQDRNPRAQYPQPRAPQGYYMGSTSSGSSPQQIYAQPGSGTQPRGPQGVGSTPSGSSPQQIYAQPGSGTQHQYQDRNPRAQYPQPRGPQGVGSTPSGSSQQISAQPGSGTQHQYQDRNPRAQYPQPRGPQGVGSTPSGSSPQQISAQPGSGTQHQYQDRNPRAQYPQPRGPQGVGSTPSGSSPQQISAQPGSGTQHQYQDRNPRAQYPQPRAPQGVGSTPSGSSPQQMYAQPGSSTQYQYPDQNPRIPQKPAWAQIVRGLSAQHPDLHQAPIPQATPVTTGGVAAQDSHDAGLTEQKPELAVQTVTPLVSKFPHRPGQGTSGHRVLVRTNHFLVQLLEKKLHQYTVTINPPGIGRATSRDVMHSLVELYQQSALDGQLPVYDGRMSLYTAGEHPFRDCTLHVTLIDNAQTQKGRDFTVQLKYVGTTDVSHLKMLLTGEQPGAPDNAIQVLDIVLREHLSNMQSRGDIIPVGRSFFSDSFGNFKLGDGSESWQGFYQSLRPTQMGLSLNFDISSTAFIDPIEVCEYVSKLLRKNLDNARLTPDAIAKIERNLKGVKVQVTHQGTMSRKYRISGLTTLPTRDLTFTCDELGTEKKVVDYFKEKYNHNIKYVNMPCLKVGNDPTKLKYLPMEVCKIVKGQRYRKKLNKNQTSTLLNATRQKPINHEKSILDMVRNNNYEEDKYAIEFGLTIAEQTTTVGARVLDPPLLNYRRSGAEEEFQPSMGAWKMEGKEFVDGGEVNFWYCISFAKVHRNSVERFCMKLCHECRSCGMKFAPRPIMAPILEPEGSVEPVVKISYQKAVELQKIPDLLIVILPDRNGSDYSDIKRICETDIGLVTQCCLSKNVLNPKIHYLRNLALKINVKVGGKNTVLADRTRGLVPIVHELPTIIFGADVTHPSPGEDTNPSIAAVVASRDWPGITTYAGTFREQAAREETILRLHEMVLEHLISFRNKNNFTPKRIIFYRDGVSEGQFEKVLKDEISAIRTACKQFNENCSPDITFIVVQKRHHTRLFPADNNMDQSGNVQPGTVVDTKICHPVEFDFYLCSHTGIQGTSRPAHYQVLLDENGFTADELQKLTYNLCYTYARCTRSVSIVPPVYYAHLTAYRARLYVDQGASDSGSFLAGSSANRGEASSSTLRQLPALTANVKEVMYYI